MLGGAIELPVNLAVTHVLFLKLYSVATARRTRCSGGLPAFARHSGRRVAAIRNLDVLDFWIPDSRKGAPRNDENQ
jgi:hypothetical protein